MWIIEHTTRDEGPQAAEEYAGDASLSTKRWQTLVAQEAVTHVDHWLILESGRKVLVSSFRADNPRDIRYAQTICGRPVSMPNWLATAPLNEWSCRNQNRRDFVVRASEATA